jgi:hypothetical protein
MMGMQVAAPQLSTIVASNPPTTAEALWVVKHLITGKRSGPICPAQ